MAITILLDKTGYNLGDEIKGTVKLELELPAKARAIFVSLHCHEQHKTKYVRNMPLEEVEEKRKLGLYISPPYIVTEEKVESHEHYHEEKKIAGQDTYLDEEFQFSLGIPKDGRPTSEEFGHDGRIVKWFVKVKIDIPFALDVNESKDVYVAGL
ncbi:MAG: hypothetical protein PHS02_04090 [Candidatus ainarchaeum sp.]|nr:hypothetical protein [Candidatus ainarchaeum sp.]